jgi:hypothetical protein
MAGVILNLTPGLATSSQLKNVSKAAEAYLETSYMLLTSKCTMKSTAQLLETATVSMIASA